MKRSFVLLVALAALVGACSSTPPERPTATLPQHCFDSAENALEEFLTQPLTSPQVTVNRYNNDAFWVECEAFLGSRSQVGRRAMIRDVRVHYFRRFPLDPRASDGRKDLNTFVAEHPSSIREATGRLGEESASWAHDDEAVTAFYAGNIYVEVIVTGRDRDVAADLPDVALPRERLEAVATQVAAGAFADLGR